MSDEFVDIVDENTGERTGKKILKSEAHEKGIWHETVHIWIYNSKGEVLLQKRSQNKESYPGLWDIPVAGHLKFHESVKEAVLREAYEEIGLKIDLSKLKKIVFNKKTGVKRKMLGKLWLNNEFQHIFILRYDKPISGLEMIDGEVEEIKFIPLSKFEFEVKDKLLCKSYVPHEQKNFKTKYFDLVISAIREELVSSN